MTFVEARQRAHEALGQMGTVCRGDGCSSQERDVAKAILAAYRSGAAGLTAAAAPADRAREALAVIQRVASPPPAPPGTPAHLVPNTKAILASIARLARDALAAAPAVQQRTETVPTTVPRGRCGSHCRDCMVPGANPCTGHTETCNQCGKCFDDAPEQRTEVAGAPRYAVGVRSCGHDDCRGERGRAHAAASAANPVVRATEVAVQPPPGEPDERDDSEDNHRGEDGYDANSCPGCGGGCQTACR